MQIVRETASKQRAKHDDGLKFSVHQWVDPLSSALPMASLQLECRVRRTLKENLLLGDKPQLT
jgi:hypothetical protein